ncbi:beta-lactamase class A [Duganella sp. CF517]|uniref:class A beta-lactamase n=1 Tax=Duganella sp. CF517 TaxID=1881038 RepID=UPI0008D508C1|nr:class A beta-lactamase [Duganella sp. CF517]SEN17595.1 beta-lactamase class A [Duganella sp. CF517]
MTHSAIRRTLLLALAATPLARAHAAPGAVMPPDLRLVRLEAQSGGRLGVAALDTADGRQLLHRADERFPFCSTFKMMLSAAVLAREPSVLQQTIRYDKAELVAHSPITERHLDGGMTIEALCAATIQYSDNTAANLLIRHLGGPEEVTAYARSIGDRQFRLDRWETALNSAIPGDPRDTTTPAAMMASLHKLTVGEALPPAKRKILTDWLIGNTTGATRIRAGVPSNWTVGDKTGAGDYGTINDIAILWPPGNKPPIVLAVYLTQPGKDDKARAEILGQAAKIVIDAFKVG